jgi:V/A-type H+-transporting ATPase subunit K
MYKGREIVLKKRTAVLIFAVQFVVLTLFSASAVFALAQQVDTSAQVDTTGGSFDRVGIALAAGIAVGLTGLGAAKAIAASGTAAISALAEKPETFFKSFLVVALAEAIAIYGLIVAILLWISL